MKSGRDRNSLTRNLCHSKVYLKCNYPNYLESQYVNYSKKEWEFIKSCYNLLPFTQLNNYKLFSLFSSDQSFCNTDCNENYFALNPSKYLLHLLNEFGNYMPNPNNNLEILLMGTIMISVK